MAGTYAHSAEQGEGDQYEIRVHGRLDARWASWFEGMALIPESNGDTLIRGQVIDQAALFGLLKKVRDAGMQLVSVNRVTASRADSGGEQS